MRLDGIDVARFLAFCGMVLVNFRIAALVTPTQDWVSQITNALEGRAAALFVVLAGVGLSLARLSRNQVLTRAAFLFVLGCLNLLVFEADILHFYALYFILAACVLQCSDRALLLGAAGIVALGYAAMFLLNYEANWNWETLEYANFTTPAGFLRHSFLNGWHPVLPWAGFVLFGMWLGRQELRARPLIIWGSVAAVIATVPQHLTQDAEIIEILGTAALPPTPFYMVSASGSACAVLGLMLWLVPKCPSCLRAPLASTGQQALTLYIAHILIGMGIMEGLGWLDGSLSTGAVFAYSIAFCVGCVAYAALWRQLFKRGPLEMLMRRIT